MKLRIVLCSAVAVAIASPALSDGVSAPGFFMQWEGTMVPSDRNPIVGWMVPDQPNNVDMDPNYDWCILETMVSDPIHGKPFHLWPERGCLDGGAIDPTMEMGYSMGVLLIWEDLNGSSPENWSQGPMLLQSAIGMNHQEDDGHSGMTMSMEFNGKAPYFWELVGSTTNSYAGSWVEKHGVGYLIRAWGEATWFDRDPSWHQTGRIDGFEVVPLNEMLGDVNLDCQVDFADVQPFLDQFFGVDHDETRHVLADLDEDGLITMNDASMFLDLVFRSTAP